MTLSYDAPKSDLNSEARWEDKCLVPGNDVIGPHFIWCDCGKKGECVAQDGVAQTQGMLDRINLAESLDLKHCSCDSATYCLTDEDVMNLNIKLSEGR